MSWSKTVFGWLLDGLLSLSIVNAGELETLFCGNGLLGRFLTPPWKPWKFFIESRSCDLKSTSGVLVAVEPPASGGETLFVKIGIVWSGGGGGGGGGTPVADTGIGGGGGGGGVKFAVDIGSGGGGGIIGVCVTPWT